MEYQKVINLLEKMLNQPSKFRTKNWVEINNDTRGTYNKKSQIKFKSSIMKSSSCDYSDAYTIDEAGADKNAKWLDKRNKGVIFKNCASFTDCISKINNTQIDNEKDLDIVMPMYNLIEYSNNCLKTSRSLWQYYRDDPNDNTVNSESF